MFYKHVYIYTCRFRYMCTNLNIFAHISFHCLKRSTKYWISLFLLYNPAYITYGWMFVKYDNKIFKLPNLTSFKKCEISFYLCCSIYLKNRMDFSPLVFKLYYFSKVQSFFNLRNLFFLYRSFIFDKMPTEEDEYKDMENKSLFLPIKFSEFKESSWNRLK